MGLGKRLVRLALLATLLGGTATVLAPDAFAVGQPAAAADQGLVRCANLSPGTPEDIYLYPFGDPMHPTVLTHDGYGSVSVYMPVKAGQYTVAMRPVGAPGLTAWYEVAWPKASCRARVSVPTLTVTWDCFTDAWRTRTSAREPACPEIRSVSTCSLRLEAGPMLATV